MRRMLVAGALGVCTVLAAALWWEAWAITSPVGYVHPRPRGFVYTQDPSTAHGLAFEDVAIGTAPGSVIRGWLVAGPAGTTRAVVYLHGRGGDRTMSLPYLPMLHDAGAAVLAIDMRENGLSDGSGRGMALAMREADDADAAVADLTRRGYRDIVLMGCSLGASAAIIAGARNKAVSTVIAEDAVATFPDWIGSILQRRLARIGLRAPDRVAVWWGDVVTGIVALRQNVWPVVSTEDAARSLGHRRLQIINAGADGTVPPANSERIFDAALGPKDLARIPGADHCSSVFVAPAVVAGKVMSAIGGEQAPDQASLHR